jgi:S1-C subfamily serine protease
MTTKPLIAGLAAAALVAASAGPASAAEPPATPFQQVSSEVQPAIVHLQSTYSAVVRDPDFHAFVGQGRTFSVSYTCSGFFVTPDGHVASAGHCVAYDESTKADILETAARWSFAHENWSPGVTLPQVIRYAQAEWKVRSPEDVDRSRPELNVLAAFPTGEADDDDGELLPARVLGFRQFEGGDVSLLKLETDDTTPVELAPADSIDVGSPIISVGYPGQVGDVTDASFDPSFKDGTVSSIQTREGGLRSVVEISSAVAPGMSGGPTIDLEGRVVGVNSFGSTASTEAFNFVSPVKELSALLADEGVQPWHPPAPAPAANRAGGDVEDGGSLPIPVELLVLAVAALAALAGGVVAFARRRSRSQAGERPIPVLRAADTATRPVPAALGHAALDQPALVVRSGPRAGERFALRGVLVLGRGGDADVRLDDAEVSRRHAAVRMGARGPELEDLGSANGTRVNGARVDGAAALAHGDVIAVGASSVAVDLGATVRRESPTAMTAVPA